MIGFSMTVEMVGPKWKTLAGNAVQIPFAIGEAIVSLIAAACTGKCLVVWRIKDNEQVGCDLKMQRY